MKEKKWFVYYRYLTDTFEIDISTFKVDFDEGYFEDTSRHGSSQMDFYSRKYGKHICNTLVFNSKLEAIEKFNEIIADLVNKKEKKIQSLNEEIRRIKEIKIES